MPKFSQEALKQKASSRGVSQEVIDQHKPFIEQLKKGNVGILEFGKGESIQLSRKALSEAGLQLKKYVKVQKVRGEQNKLKFWQITKKDFDEARSMAQARGKKLRGRRKTRNSA